MVGQMSRCFKVFCNFVNKPTKTFAACCKFIKKSMFNEYNNLRPYGQAVKTSPFHGGIPGSNPGRVTIMTYHHLRSKWYEGQMSRCFKVACNFVNKPTFNFKIKKRFILRFRGKPPCHGGIVLQIRPRAHLEGSKSFRF